VADGPEVCVRASCEPVVGVSYAVVALLAADSTVDHGWKVLRTELVHPRRKALVVRRRAAEGESGDAVAHEEPRIARTGRRVVHLDLVDLHAIRALRGGRGDHDLDPAPLGELEAVCLPVRDD